MIIIKLLRFLFNSDLHSCVKDTTQCTSCIKEMAFKDVNQIKHGAINRNIEIYFILNRYCSFIANFDLIPGRNNTAQIDHFAGRMKI